MGSASESVKDSLKCVLYISYLKIRNSKCYIDVNLKVLFLRSVSFPRKAS